MNKRISLVLLILLSVLFLTGCGTPETEAATQEPVAITEAPPTPEPPPPPAPTDTEPPPPEGWVVLETEAFPSPRSEHAMTTLSDGRILLFGGMDEDGNVLNDTWIFGPDENAQHTIPGGRNPFASFAGLGWLAFRFFLQSSLNRSSDEFLIPALLITLGLAFILEEGTLALWDRSMAGLVSQFATIRLGQIYLPGNRLVVLLLMLLISAALQLWLTRTDSGRCLRALSQEPIGATLVGISLVRVTGITFAMATGLAAMAGLFYVTLFTISPHLGLPLTLKALFIVVVSGSGSLMRPLAGGLVLGTLETMLAAPFGAHWANALSIFLLLACLCWRPQGLFIARPNTSSR